MSTPGSQAFQIMQKSFKCLFNGSELIAPRHDELYKNIVINLIADQCCGSSEGPIWAEDNECQSLH